MTGVAQTDKLKNLYFVGQNNFTQMRKVSFSVFNLPPTLNDNTAQQLVAYSRARPRRP